jgi:hypothetical protein
MRQPNRRVREHHVKRRNEMATKKKTKKGKTLRKVKKLEANKPLTKQNIKM